MADSGGSGHPAPVPVSPRYSTTRALMYPPVLHLDGYSSASGIYLRWDVLQPPRPVNIEAFEVYCYKEGNEPPEPSLWTQLAEVALPFPGSFMAEGLLPQEKYHFTVRARDSSGRRGPFSEPFTCAWFPRTP